MPDLPLDLPALIQQCAPHVAEQTLRPLIDVESARNPHAIGFKVVAKNGAEHRLIRQPINVTEARQWARWLLANGYRFDVGITQVNTVNFKQTGLTPENMFDPCTNIRAGAYVLANCYQRAKKHYRNEQDALHAAFSCYQSGNFRTGFMTGYVSKILATAGVSPSTRVHQTNVPVEQINIHDVSSEIPSFGTHTPTSSGNVETEPQ